ncbi:DUF4435 domain-containing protein [Shewanella mangrovisoli]|uniref:DUF4435 domain-containing protein n=1 Tax=Shewanella mangrovisoli TaxID=2864211 RepID=UPI00313E55D6
MSDFSYSIEAEGVLDLFFKKDIVVYVEGQDDIPFWEYILDEFGEFSFEMRDVGGCEALEPFIDAVLTGDIRAIVALDRDFRLFKGEQVEHTNVLMTPKYSIENTMIADDIIVDSVISIAKISRRNFDLASYKDWSIEFFKRMNKLILIDVYNAKHELGLSVISDSADIFWCSKGSVEISQDKLDAHLTSLMVKIGEDIDFDSIEAEVVKMAYEKGVQDFIRGHFLFSAVTKYIRIYLKRIGVKSVISNDAFYTAFLLSLKSRFNRHGDYNYFKTKVEGVMV